MHTFDALRLRSTPLFTSVICAAAKYSRGDLHPALLSHSNLLIERAIVAGLEDTALVQSILVSIYYQPYGETSAWKKIGWAIRLGYQFRWHEVRKRSLPADERAKREILVRTFVFMRASVILRRRTRREHGYVSGQRGSDLMIGLYCMSRRAQSGCTDSCLQALTFRKCSNVLC